MLSAESSAITYKLYGLPHKKVSKKVFLNLQISHLASPILIIILSSLCKWKQPKWLFLFVKRYAVRKAKQMAVRNAKIERYAVHKGGGVSPSVLIKFNSHCITMRVTVSAHLEMLYMLYNSI